MKKIIVFTNELEETSMFYKHLLLLDEQGIELHLFNEEKEIKHTCYFLLEQYNKLLVEGKQEDTYSFLTDQEYFRKKVDGLLRWMPLFETFGYWETNKGLLEQQPWFKGKMRKNHLNCIDQYFEFLMYFESMEQMMYAPFELALKNNIYGITKKCLRFLEEKSDYQEVVFSYIETLINELVDKNITVTIYLLTILIDSKNSSEHLKRVLMIIQDKKELTNENQFFLWNQCMGLLFRKPALGQGNIHRILKEIYNQIYKTYKENYTLEKIPMKERKKEKVIIITNQLLSERHAPTHSLLERSYILKRYMKKEVYIINTRELLTTVGSVLFWDCFIANCVEKYTTDKSIIYQGEEFPVYQPENPMPNKSGIQTIIELVQTIKPYYIINIGGNSLIADLICQMVPMVSIATVFSNLPFTKAHFSMIGRNLKEKEKINYRNQGYAEDEIIESTFTFEIKKKEETITRKQLGIPEEAFVMAVIGSRLDSDIEIDFIEMLLSITKKRGFVVFIGLFQEYEKWCYKFQELKEHSISLGYCDDVIAVLENCDLYVNPKRMGGGFSVIEAFHVGIPAVTTKMGDVAVASGEEFWVEDYEEMKETIQRYMEDREFYNKMVQLGKEREKVVTNGEIALEKALEQMLNSKRFF